MERGYLRQVGCSSCMYKCFSVICHPAWVASQRARLHRGGTQTWIQGEKVHQSACISSSVCWSGTSFICHFPLSTSMYCSLLPIRGLASPIATFALISSPIYVSRSSCFPSNSLCWRSLIPMQVAVRSFFQSAGFQPLVEDFAASIGLFQYSFVGRVWRSPLQLWTSFVVRYLG